MHLGPKRGDVKIAADGTALMFVDGFHPICGHFFWNNRTNGANLFCRKMGYQHGVVVERNVHNSVKAVQVGICTEDDVDVAECTGGKCNTLKVGGICKDLYSCKAGGNAAVKIECKESSEVTQPCNSEFF